nr:hypothetical protein [Tanacetum cinerariifolium]
PSNDNTNVANALQNPFVVNQDPDKNSSQSPLQINYNCCYGCGDLLEGIFCHQCTYELCGKGAHYGYNCPPKVPIIPDLESFNNQTVDELPQTLLSFNPTCYSEDGNSFTYDSTSNIVHDSANVFDPPSQPPLYSCEFYGNDARYGHYCTPHVPDPHEAYQCQPMNEDYYHEQNSCYDPNSFGFDQFQPPQYTSFSDEDILKKIYSNPLFDEEIISIKIDPHPFNAESNIIESLLNHESLIISSSSKIDSFFDEFAGEITISNQFHRELIKLIVILRKKFVLSRDCCMITHLLVHRKNLFLKILMLHLNLSLHLLSPLRIVTLSWKKLIYLFTLDDPMPSGIEEDDYDSERDTLILEELFSNDSLSLAENESFHFDIPLSSRPPAKPPDGNSGNLNVKVIGCAILGKKFKEDLFTYCIENGILQDSSEPSNDNTNVVNALQEPFVVKKDPGSLEDKIICDLNKTPDLS